MNVDGIREYCLAFSDTTEKLQWGDALCFKVRTKMFTIMGLDDVRLTFKCTPEKFAELIEREGIRPAPYVGRYHWVMLDRLDAVQGNELKDLIRQSYEMVAANAPRRNAKGSRLKKKSKRADTARKSQGKSRAKSETKSKPGQDHPKSKRYQKKR